MKQSPGKPGGQWKTVGELFLCTLKIGAFTFGGGFAMIPIMQREFVTKRGWVSETDILDIFAIAQSIPGVIALNSSLFIGHKIAGRRGAAAAALGVSLPSLCVISVLSLFYTQFQQNIYLTAALRGVRPCVVALILQAVFKLGKPAVKDLAGWILAALGFGLVAFWGVNPIFVILGAGLGGFLLQKLTRKRRGRDGP